MAVAQQIITNEYALYNGDCIDVMRALPDGKVDLSIHSPPFCGLYQYSSNPRDLSNCKSYLDFFEHYEFVVAELARLTKPGRIAAVHCMDIPKDGANICGSIDFPGDIIRLFEKHGFEYTPRIVIWKEPLAVRNRTMAKALAHCQICEDATRTNVAAADYLIPFRKRGKNPVPVTHPVGLLGYAGACSVPHELIQFRGWTGDQKQNKFSHWIWRRYASCIWDDIRIDRVLEFQPGRDEHDEKHCHPLQLDVIDRAVVLWSNPGEIVLTPFLGVGSEAYGAVANDRKAIGVELKESYFRQAVRNMERCKDDLEQKEFEIASEASRPELDAPDFEPELAV